MMIVSLLLLAILTFGAVSTSDDISEDLGVEDQDILSLDESVGDAAVEDVLSLDNSESDSVEGPLHEGDDSLNEGSNEVLSTNPKTFTDLNNAINGNSDSDVYLEGNYNG